MCGRVRRSGNRQTTNRGRQAERRAEQQSTLIAPVMRHRSSQLSMLSQMQQRAAAAVLTRGAAAVAAVAAPSSLRCAAAASAPRRLLSVRPRSQAPRVTVAAERPNVSNAPIRVAIKRDERFARVRCSRQEAPCIALGSTRLAHPRLAVCVAVPVIVADR